MSTIAAGHGFRFESAVRPSTSRPVAVRLTRRGRIVLLAVFVGIVFCTLTVFGGQSAATDRAGAPVETRTVVVDEGDTLWAIASEIADPGEVREMIYHIQKLNALSSASLERGQELAVPMRQP